ncbi:uncharacterized protein LOC134260317 isoform X2 [Saccostrea cucullata]|uniref:uncharacterized protein LOC134260317 isoform X2 n=1 Tax=Saccostrea cuccullata TaxID=36930 RepID=UPI002ED5009A
MGHRQMMKYLFTAWIMSITFGPYILCSLQDRDPKCRYTVHLPEASWHTAYSVCASRNRTLAQITSLSEMYFLDLVLEEVDNLLEKHSSLRISAEVWIGAFLRSSNNESMLENCNHLDSQVPVEITGVGLGDMFCLYYSRLNGTLVTGNCSTAKMFICVNNDEDPGECMINSTTSAIKNQIPFKLCFKQSYYPKKTSRECESFCMEEKSCYTFINIHNCTLYEYTKEQHCSIGRHPPSKLRHKSFFLYSSSSYPTSKTNPLSSWCPEVTEKDIQEKINNIQKNLTINRKETRQYIRTLTSAPDERRSSRNIGIVGSSQLPGCGDRPFEGYRINRTNSQVQMSIGIKRANTNNRGGIRCHDGVKNPLSTGHDRTDKSVRKICIENVYH